jgi:ribosome-binding protein aMBF1 (putative translation factor)
VPLAPSSITSAGDAYVIFAYFSGISTLFYNVKSGREAEDRERIASLLRELRVARGLRQIDVAKALGEPQSYVSRYESGEQRLDLVELRKVCSVLNLSLLAFIRKIEAKK